MDIILDIRNCAKEFDFSLTRKYDPFTDKIISNDNVNPTRDYYGDSLFFYSDNNAQLQHQLQILLILCSYLISKGIKERNYLIRAGIAAGDLLIKHHEDGNIFIGSSIVKAHNLESSQDWIGGAICLDDFSSKYLTPGNEVSLIEEYPVPFKNQCNNYEYVYPINWLNFKSFKFLEISDSDIKYLKTERDKFKNDKIIHKFDNTLEYIDFCMKRMR